MKTVATEVTSIGAHQAPSPEPPRFARFRDLTAESFSADCQMHTTFTDGLDSVAGMAAQAHRIGLRAIAITEHVRRDTRWFDEFRKEVRRVRRMVPITLWAGIEAKALDFDGTLDAPRAAVRDADLVVGVVHRYPDGHGGSIPVDYMKAMYAGHAAEIEFRAALGIVEHPGNGAGVLGHPFGIYSGLFGTPPWDLVERLVAAAAPRGIAVEISMKYWLGKPFLNLLREFNPLVSFGSDAHQISEIARRFHATRQEVLNLCFE